MSANEVDRGCELGRDDPIELAAAVGVLHVPKGVAVAERLDGAAQVLLAVLRDQPREVGWRELRGVERDRLLCRGLPGVQRRRSEQQGEEHRRKAA